MTCVWFRILLTSKVIIQNVYSSCPHIFFNRKASIIFLLFSFWCDSSPSATVYVNTSNVRTVLFKCTCCTLQTYVPVLWYRYRLIKKLMEYDLRSNFLSYRIIMERFFRFFQDSLLPFLSFASAFLKLFCLAHQRSCSQVLVNELKLRCNILYIIPSDPSA